MHVTLFYILISWLSADMDCFCLFKAWQLSEIVSQDRNFFKGREDWCYSSVVQYLSSTSEALCSILSTAMYNASDCIYWFSCLSVDTNSWADCALWYFLGETLRSRCAFIRIYFGGIMEVLRFHLGAWVWSTHLSTLYTAGLCGTCFNEDSEIVTPGWASSESLVRWRHLLQAPGDWTMG